MQKEYFYTNSLGRKKSIVVDTEKTEKGYYCTIWDYATGEYCGSGYNPKADLKQYFDHFDIQEEQFDEIFK